MTMTSHAHCPTRGHAVSLDQTEGQCRDKHNCSDEACPLEHQFGQERFAKSLSMMAASIGQSFVKASER
jgi:hypothetical protein